MKIGTRIVGLLITAIAFYVLSAGPVLGKKGMLKSGGWQHPLYYQHYHTTFYFPVYWICNHSPATEMWMAFYIERCGRAYRKLGIQGDSPFLGVSTYRLGDPKTKPRPHPSTPVTAPQ